MGTMIAIQVVWFLLFMYKLTDYSLGINIALKTLSLLVVLHIMGKNNNPASKLALDYSCDGLPIAWRSSISGSLSKKAGPES